MNNLPPEAGVLPKSARLWYWATLNRVKIGAFLLAVAVALGASLDPANAAAHRWLEVGQLLIVLLTGAGGGTLIGAGKYKSDDYHRDEMNADIRSASGQFPAFQRREGDSNN